MKTFFSVFLTVFLLQTIVVYAQDNANPTGALPISATEGVQNPIIAQPVPTIGEFVTNSQQNRVLLELAKALDLTETLSQPGTRLTVLAPNDNAFASLARALGAENVDASRPQKVVAQLTEGLEKLGKVPGAPDARTIVTYHLLTEPFPYEKLVERGSARTQNGKFLKFTETEIIDLDDSRDANASVSTKNVFAQNGWIHGINRVLLPFNAAKAIRAAEGIPDPTITPAVSPETAASPEADTESETDTPTTVGPASTDDETLAEPSDEDTDAEGSPDGTSDGDSDDDDDNVCFPASATVRTVDGRDIPMNQLEAGDVIRHAEHNEKNAFSNVFLFTHRMPAVKKWFYKISTATGHSVTMTAKHYLHANNQLVSADAVVLGDMLRTVSGNSPVVAISRVQEEGLYAPHTMHGDLVVDGIVVSGYSKSVHPSIAHALLAPVRLFVKTTGMVEPMGSLFYEGADGIATWVPEGASRH